ncbi:unnamed protein product [Discosporangium mesarthrocarpum]
MDPVTEVQRAGAVGAGLGVYDFSEVEGIGAAHPKPHHPPSATDLATFC